MRYDHVFSSDEARTVLDELEGMRSHGPYHARVIVQTHQAIEQWHVEIDEQAERWFAVSEHGAVHEYRDGRTWFDGEPLPHPTTMTTAAVTPVQPAFPGSLPFWGSHRSGFRPILAERVGRTSLFLTFAHGVDPAMRATLVFDTGLGIVTRVMHFDSPYVVVLDVELGRGIERRMPEAYPELSVIEPDY